MISAARQKPSISVEPSRHDSEQSWRFPREQKRESPVFQVPGQGKFKDNTVAVLRRLYSSKGDFSHPSVGAFCWLTGVNGRVKWDHGLSESGGQFRRSAVDPTAEWNGDDLLVAERLSSGRSRPAGIAKTARRQ